MYGRVRRLAGLLQGRTGRFVAVGGVPAVRRSGGFPYYT